MYTTNISPIQRGLVSFFVLAFCKIRVHFHTLKVSILWEKGLFNVLKGQRFEKKKGPFLTKKSVVRGSFLFWRTIIRPPFMLEWRDRAQIIGVQLPRLVRANSSFKRSQLLCPGSHVRESAPLPARPR